MTKKFLFGTMAAALMMATACTSEMDVVAPNGGEAMVAVSVDVPQLQMNSRAFSDGLKATTLKGALYEVTGSGTAKTVKLVNVLDTDENFQLKKTVSLKLRTGNTYALIFWADASKSDSQDKQSPYAVTFEQTGAKMEADYQLTEAGVLFSAGNDKLDAFYCYEEFTVAGDMAVEAKLYRPFAQINIGTNDLDEIDEKATVYSKLRAHNVYKSMDLVTGFVTGEPTDVDLQNTTIPQNEEFPVKGYEYLTMGYFLVGQTKADDPEKSLIDVDFIIDITGEPTIDYRHVSNVPVQRNYRTNIYGQLITSNVIDNVEIIPGYDGTTEPGYEYTDLDLLADKGGELTLTSDIDIDHDIIITNSGVLNLNGFEVTSSNGKQLVIRGEKISRANEATAVLTIKGNGTVSLPISVEEDGKLKIEGGRYTETITAPAVAAGEEAAVEITGGTFEKLTDEQLQDFVSEENSQIVDNGDSKLVVSKETILVTADNFKSAISKGGELLLMVDYKYPDTRDLNLLKDMTLDLNGHELSAVGGNYGDAVVIGNGANVTIKNGTIKEADGATQAKSSAVVIIKTSYATNVTLENVEVEGMRPIYLNNANPETTVTIKSGKYVSTGGNGEAVYVQNGGKLIIEGGYFANPNNAQNPKSYLLNILDSLRTGKDPREFLVVKGGTFVNFDPSNNGAEGPGTNFVANGYKVISYQDGADTIYEVVPN